MAKYYVRLFIVALIAAFCIFFGVDLASKGVERVQGPTGPAPVKQTAAPPAKTESKPAGVTAHAGAAKPAAGSSAAGQDAKTKQEEPVRSEVTEDTGINRVSNKAGELLQIISYHGIKFIVSILDAIIG
ncbi:hypothetical protein [Paenibacillus hamazuiensis]|uniref:hypothetical protein n=1 Tax=Paenibacillus hamazuiensis TaxID=2936508 RepID=UPI00200D7A4F|nr:hypothetical protein [Paenibacillus hamazuiensis]